MRRGDGPATGKRRTAKAGYLGGGHREDDSIAIEECRDEEEATRIADFYAVIIRDLERQRGAQRQ